MNSMTFAERLALRGRQPFHTLLSKMESLKGRIKQSWKPLVPCFMNKGYRENSKAYRIYVPGQRDVEVRHNVTFDEDTTLGKAKGLPIPRKDNDDAEEKQDEPPTNKPMPNVEGPMDPIDPPPSDPSTSRKIPLWLKDTLEDAERHIALRGTFQGSKKPNRYQAYLDAMSTIVQTEPCTFKEVIKHQV